MGYYNEYSNIKSMKPSSKFYYLKKLTQILLSVSVFSFLFSQSSLVPVLVHSYDYVVSKYSIKLFTYTAERNYIFLLCNGILVVIIRTSGLISKTTPVQTSSKGGDSHDQKADEPGFQEKNKAEKITTKVEVFEENDEEECGIVAAEVDSTKEDCKSYDQIEELEEEEEEEAEEEGIDEELSTDELNKKFEDFIKKVKQEIQAAK